MTALETAQANLDRANRALTRAQADVTEAQSVIDALTTQGTSPEVASLAARGISDPESLTPEEVASVCASALSQKPEKPAKPKDKSDG